MAIKVGILGGGFGGLYTVFYLRRYLEKLEVTFFDKNNFLLYTPVLHEMATGTVDARHLVIPIRKVIDPRRVHIRCEEVTQVDLDEGALETRSGRFRFDFLVLAQGSESNFYSIPGLQDNCITFKTIEDAIRLRNGLIGLLEQAALEKDTGKKRNLLTISVAGGGCTGVEVVAEIAQFVNIILPRDYPEIDRSQVRIILIEGLERILPSFPEFLSHVAAERLRRMGIEVLLDSFIERVDHDAIRLRNGGSIPKGILIWAGGVKAREISLKPEARRDQSRRIFVDEFLQVPGYERIYAIGDGSHVETDGALPPTASVAVQEARYVAESIIRRAENRPVSPFRFRNRGDMASLGFMFGVSEIYGRRFKGPTAWFIWKAFKLGMLPSYKNRFQIMADWLITLLFKRDTSKLV